MPREKMRCERCEEAGLPQRFNWRRTNRTDVGQCGMCGREKDFRLLHALHNGGNVFIEVVRKGKKVVCHCKTHSKVAYTSTKEAEAAAYRFAYRAYYDAMCGFYHLSSKPVRG